MLILIFVWASGNTWYVALPPNTPVLVLLSVMIIRTTQYLNKCALFWSSTSLLLSRTGNKMHPYTGEMFNSGWWLILNWSSPFLAINMPYSVVFRLVLPTRHCVVAYALRLYQSSHQIYWLNCASLACNRLTWSMHHLDHDGCKWFHIT